MSTAPLIPDTAPFSPEQRAWLNGFLAGVFSRTPGQETSNPRSEVSNPPALAPLTILFGSQTGTAEGLARKAAKAAGRRGFAATVLDMAQADLGRLAGEKHLLVITSTYGDGEPPDNAKALHAALQSAVAANGDAAPPPRLAGLRYSVCALGDTNYARFCQCGKDLDAWLERLGAVRIAPRADCDLDYDTGFTAWLDAALAALSTTAPSSKDQMPGAGSEDPEIVSRKSEIVNQSAAAQAAAYSKKNPFPAPVLAVRRLNAAASAKEVNHIELALEGSGLTYEVGDALGVFPQNCPDLVAEVIAALGCDGEEAVLAPDGSTTSLRHALTAFYDVVKPTPELTALLAPVGATLVASDSAGVGSKLPSPPLHVIDILHHSKNENPKSKIPPPADFVRLLRKLQPRLYSISSSPKAHPGQVHLTVGAVRYELAGRARKGVCSTFLPERATAAGRVGVFVHANKAFRPPASGDTPVIMVGPGTGIAPFRAFLQERRATGARGRNWLFFGDQRETTDFLYRDELLAFRRDGLLTNLDLAWSRDQAAKIYVQDRMLGRAAELFAWLEAGAHFYVCGDAARMARDVDAALHQVVQAAGGRSPESAAAYVQSLRSAKRYQRDVY